MKLTTEYMKQLLESTQSFLKSEEQKRGDMPFDYSPPHVMVKAKELESILLLALSDPKQESINLKPHIYRELVNQLRDTAIKYFGTQQLREQISRTLQLALTPAHDAKPNKTRLEKHYLEAALSIKPGYTLGVMDTLLIHEMAKALLPLVDDPQSQPQPYGSEGHCKEGE